MSGRKSRVKKVKEENAVASEVQEESVVPKKKTSRKKQFPVVATVGPDGIEGNLMGSIVKRPLIVHFPIQSKDIPNKDMPIAYDPLPPGDTVPYDREADNPFCDTVEAADLPSVPADQYTEEPNPVAPSTQGAPSVVVPSAEEVDFYKVKGTLLIQYKASSEVKTIPESSDAACFWCCHEFTGRPVVLPVRDTGEYLIVMGNFCCPECAMAYLFDMHQDSHTRWEQLSLLHRIYSDVCKGAKIHPAPPRSVLKLFGGLFSIQEYRALIRSHSVRVDLHLPPMVSILATMDTKPIDFYDTSLTKNISETVKERLQKAEEVLRLRRTKPLKAWESTLDACINLKIRHEEQ